MSGVVSCGCAVVLVPSRCTSGKCVRTNVSIGKGGTSPIENKSPETGETKQNKTKIRPGRGTENNVVEVCFPKAVPGPGDVHCSYADSNSIIAAFPRSASRDSTHREAPHLWQCRGKHRACIGVCSSHCERHRLGNDNTVLPVVARGLLGICRRRRHG
jgi:hypothetical protein